MPNDPLVPILLYFILPLWLLAGIADWLCHRATHIQKTAGAKESVFHLLMLAEVGLPLLAALFLEINAGIILLMLVAFFVHQVTAFWDVSYAVKVRNVTPLEQHVHSYLEMIPLLGIVCVVALHWGQFLALFGAGPETASFALAWKTPPLPVAYVAGLIGCVVLLELLPFVEEFWRGLRANNGRLVPDQNRGAKR